VPSPDTDANPSRRSSYRTITPSSPRQALSALASRSRLRGVAPQKKDTVVLWGGEGKNRLYKKNQCE
jgi:hypothetical protein